AGRPCRIVVTAPRRSAADAVFRHAARRLGLAPARGDLRLGAGRELRFVAPDRLLREPPAADLVLVDEAAAIPAPLLEALLRRDPRIVYATTVHGYEGTGRGFALRFRASLDRLAPGWREVELEVPVRWAAEDPLEAWLNRSLLLDAAPASPAASGNAPRCRRLDRDALLDDEPRLRHLFGLLVQAHYRTTPSDLRQLLDAPGVGLHVAEVDDVPVGVAVTVAEGRIDAATSLAVWAGLRRLRGHLVAQSLAGHAGLEAAPQLAIRRVQRIAVDPGWRRRGVGRALLASLARESREAGDDLVATSFGMTPGLLAFWTACGFRPARVGLRREASSGAHALMMLHPLSDDGEALADEAARRLGGALPILLRDVLADLESELADPLRACLPPPPTGCTEADWLEAVAFAFGARGPDACAASLQRVVGTLRLRSALPGPPQGAALTARFLDHAPWARVASQLGCRGRGQAIRQLRAALRPALRARHATGLAERIARLEGLRHDPARGSSGDDPSRE
ncbi:MAG: GNAT family N-acetyltransferase, partial [Gammaproteobacteria bacterium]|nr:GNAT family N-acetyltransferase [Gammaproteobacteria bacterium]